MAELTFRRLQRKHACIFCRFAGLASSSGSFNGPGAAARRGNRGGALEVGELEEDEEG